MGAAISFYAGNNFLAGNGLGLFGDAGFGAPIPVGSWQGRTFISDGAGTLQGAEVTNFKYASPTGAIVGQTGTPLTLNCLPNYQSLNIRLTNDTPVRTQNAKIYVYDRVNKLNPASGITTAIYEVSHLANNYSGIGSGGPGTPTISGNHAWTVFTGGVPATGGMAMTASPGLSGQRPSGTGTVSSQHDWYLAVTASPDSAGAKSWGILMEAEYL